MDEWYVIKIKPREEPRARVHLENQGFDYYFPKLVLKNQKEESLFPGYGFLFHDTVENLPYHKIRSTRGLNGFLRFGMGEPVKVSTELIDTIKQQEKRLAGKPVFSKGDVVEFRDGPFKELQGVYLSDSGLERSMVLINFLNREQRVQVPQRVLRKGA
ncbi:transcription termination/antitermination NusG family protein [Spongorhabdus nitratireducens]